MKTRKCHIKATSWNNFYKKLRQCKVVLNVSTIIIPNVNRMSIKCSLKWKRCIKMKICNLILAHPNRFEICIQSEIFAESVRNVRLISIHDDVQILGVLASNSKWKILAKLVPARCFNMSHGLTTIWYVQVPTKNSKLMLLPLGFKQGVTISEI